MTDLARILAGPLLWLAGFTAIYGLHGVLCGAGGPAPRLPLAAAWLLLILMQAAVLAALVSERLGATAPTVRKASLITGWTGLVAALWTLFPTVATTSCQ